MNQPTGILSTLEYPGRLISIGTATGGDKVVIVYAITGRSPSSQARKLVARDEGVWVQPTDEDILKRGNVDLLVYPAVLFHPDGIAISNGKQTADIRDGLGKGGSPVCILAGAMERWDFEPDGPIFTPRISGCVRVHTAGLGLVRRGQRGETLRSYFEVPLRPGQASLVSTYRGPNSDPLPCFAGEPLEMALEGTKAEETAVHVYSALGTRAPERDFRVAVACIFASLAAPAAYDLHIINRCERT
jgi:IMP cyclohydrolase